MIIWQQFPTKTKKNAFATPCVQVLWGSGCKSTLPKQWDCLLGEGRVEVALCFNFWLSFPGEHEAAHSALPALGLPSVSAAEESSQSIARELCSPALCFSPKSDDSLLAQGRYVQTPFSPGNTLRVWISEYGCSWPSISARCLLTLSFLENSFFMEINLFGQRFSLLLFGFFSAEWVDSNSNTLSRVWVGATSLHHLQAVARVACGVEELGGRPGGSWLQKCGSRTGHSFFTPKFPPGRGGEVWPLLRFHPG